MIKYILPIICLLFATVSWGALPPTRMILQKTSENAGSGLYAIEQEVQFSSGESTMTLRETWLIENERAMRLTVTGDKELGAGFKLQFVYNGGQKWSLVSNSRKNEKISSDFIERFFHYRNPENLAQNLVLLKILPADGFQKRPVGRVGTDFKYQAEPWLRYSRTGGVVNYAFGIPANPNQDLSNPGLWVEQDRFVIRKLRLPSQAEVSADNYSEFSKGLSLPRMRTLRWGSHTATIRLISVAARPATASNQVQPQSLDINTTLEGLKGQPAYESVTEFYSRFR
jgi:hypothetical protein